MVSLGTRLGPCPLEGGAGCGDVCGLCYLQRARSVPASLRFSP